MSERRTDFKLTNSRPRGENILSEKEKERETEKYVRFRDEKHQRHFRRRIERESVGMSSRLWASLKARSSQRNHGGDGPRPVLQPSRDQVCQWRRCVCGVCFCASSRSFYSPFISKRIGEFRNFEPINRAENRVFLRLSFFLSRTKGKKSENLLRVRLVGANPWSKLIRTNAYPRCARAFLEKRFSMGEDFMGESEHQSERWVARFFPIGDPNGRL